MYRHWLLFLLCVRFVAGDECGDHWVGAFPFGPNPVFAQQTSSPAISLIKETRSTTACCARCLWYTESPLTSGNVLTYMSRRLIPTSTFFAHTASYDVDCEGGAFILQDDLVFEWNDISVATFVPVDSHDGHILFTIQTTDASSGSNLFAQADPSTATCQHWDVMTGVQLDATTKKGASPYTDGTVNPDFPLPLDTLGNIVAFTVKPNIGSTPILSYATGDPVPSLRLYSPIAQTANPESRKVFYHIKAQDSGCYGCDGCAAGFYLVSSALVAHPRADTEQTTVKVWCGPPVDIKSSECGGSRDDHGLVVGKDRGCLGYGRCPIGTNGQVCSGRGTCLPSGDCLCTWTLKAGSFDEKYFGIGPACEIDASDNDVFQFLPYFKTKGKVPCSVYNPCFGKGVCVDVDGAAQCTCFGGWVGTPGDALSAALYARTFICASGDCTKTDLSQNPPLPLAVMQKNLVQCAIWFDPTGIHRQRYFDASTSTMGSLVESDYVSRPLWVSGPGDPQIPAGQLHITEAGYACADRRSTGGFLYGGVGCQICPSCNVSNSKCIQDPDTPNDVTARVCQCYPNYGNSYVGTNKTLKICDKPICPVALGGVCGNSTTRGTCIYDPSNPLTGGLYLGYCQCQPGYGGPACQYQLCPTDDNNIICGLGTRALSCSNTSCGNTLSDGCGTCICNSTKDSGWLNGAKHVCELPRCPLDGYGNECGGVTLAGTTTNVCDRSPSRICQCWAGIPRNPDNSLINTLNTTGGRWGKACQNSYVDQCAAPGDVNVLCNNGVGVCDVPLSAIQNRDPTVAPSCTCNPTLNAAGSYCEQSACAHQAGYSAACTSPLISTRTGICNHTCPDPRQKQCPGGTYFCSCLIANPQNNLQCGVDTPFDSNCRIYSNVNPTDSTESDVTCKFDLGGCTSCTSTGCKLCSNIPGTCFKQADSSFACVCPSGYSGTYCQTTAACAGVGGCADTPGTACLNGACSCGAFFSGTRCDVNSCTTSGGVYSLVAGKPQCNCTIPTDPYAYYDSAQKKCVKQCPVSNGNPCGAPPRDSNPPGRDRCSNHTTAITSSYSPLCDCTTLARAVEPSGPYVGWIKTTSTGSCEIYCKNGGIFSIVSSSYSCSCDINWIGSRCDVPACYNGGIMNPNDNLCQCNTDNPLVDFPYTRASACNISACAPNGTYVVGQSTCNCYAPFAASHDPTKPRCIDPCAPYGVPNVTLGKCVCDAFHYGPFCKHTDCYPNTITGSTCSCVNGGTWNGTACAIPLCQNGGEWDPTQKLCICAATWGGYDCSTDMCQVGGHGRAILSVDGWTCNCDEGYYIPTNGQDGNCSASHCVGGTVAVCYPRSAGKPPKDTCMFTSLAYNCLCNLPSVFQVAANCDNGVLGTAAVCGVCSPPDCGFGVVVASTDGSGSYKCQCDLGWATDTHGSCTVNTCDANEFPDWLTGDCSCYAPFTGATCKDSDCGSGSTGPVNLAKNNGTDTPGIQIGIDNWQCACKAGYVNGGTPDKYGIFPCVRNCSSLGTRLHRMVDDTCVCLDGFSGDLCDTGSAVVTTASSSSSTLSTGAIAGIAVGGVAFLAGVGIFVYVAVTHGWCAPHSSGRRIDSATKGLVKKKQRQK